MRAVLIDPESQTVEEIETKGKLADIHSYVGDSLDSFRIADHGSSYDYGWIADTGLVDNKPVHAFRLDNRDYPLAGRCFVIGVNKETRNNTDAKMTVAFLAEHIEWLGIILPIVTWEEDGNVTRANVSYEKVKT